MPTTLLPCSPDTMCDNNFQETNDVLRIIIIVVVSTLCLLIVATIIILLILVWFKKQRRKSNIGKSDSPNNSEIKTDTNLAYHTVTSEIISHFTTSVATPPVTISMLDIATRHNEAYAGSGSPLTVNPAYGLVQSSTVVHNTTEDNSGNTLEYDYI